MARLLGLTKSLTFAQRIEQDSNVIQCRFNRFLRNEALTQPAYFSLADLLERFPTVPPERNDNACRRRIGKTGACPRGVDGCEIRNDNRVDSRSCRRSRSICLSLIM